ncbi:hypothetical protein [Novosphingobium sp. AP12]|uniref:hypothetical protein n=1 Tax=Novosphingobium sp. AP12 TaxID=1144305 RepID=UPI00027205D1|nr:hypothetical protein [Novosphingobium sp. AP12]EJL23949.1 hypothetical protein PMI02_03869 [Novosphingobium sp. AP12]
MTLAFRLYGRFRWPPATSASPTIEARSGVLEIHFEAAADGHRGALRWLPGTGDLDGHPPEPVVPENIVGDLALDHIASHGNAGWTVWLDEAAAKGGLNFRGAFLIEQFNGDGSLDLRLPLANGVFFEDTGVEAADRTSSGLRTTMVGKTATFRLYLNIPLPVSQSQVSQARAFPLVAQYLCYPTGSKPVAPTIHRLFGGWARDNATGGSLIALDKHKVSASKFKLGNFGFSERGEWDRPYGQDFVIYNESTANIGRYWPENSRCFVEDVLGAYGFSLPTHRWLGYSRNDPADLSLRFSRTGKDGPVTGLVYRVRVQRDEGGDHPSDESDLVSDEDGRLMLRLADELGGRRVTSVHYGLTGGTTDIEGWLATGSQLSADCELSWGIKDNTQWAIDQDATWSPVVAIRLHWDELVDAITSTPVVANKPFERGLVGFAAHTFAAVRQSLLPGEAGHPPSFLPDLKLGSAKEVRFCLYGSPLPARTDAHTGLVAWGAQSDGDGNPSGAHARPPMRLTLIAEDDRIDHTPEADGATHLSITANGITFFQAGKVGVPVPLTLSHDQSWRPTVVGGPSTPDFFASFAVRTDAANATAWNGRLASLAFLSEGKFKDAKAPDAHLRIGGKGDGRGRARLLYPQGRIAAELRLVLPASTVTPIGVDVGRFDRSGRAAPLLIALEASESGPDITGGNDVRYWLSATETILPRTDRQLRADIYDVDKDGGERSYAVLSFEPFSVFRFRHQPLSDRGRADSASVAIYSGDDRVWQYRTVSQYYRYSLPPQVIGESAEKPRRLEIHDLPVGADDAEAARPFVRHYLKDEAGDVILDEDGNAILDEAKSDRQRRAVEYRLTPSAELWIAPSDVARGYFIPEAASHDIFRQSGAYGLGAALAYLRAEFLFGMPVGIDVSKERSIARGARVAEIEALVGHPTGPARETDAEPVLSDRWDALRAAFARRPERLEIWARDLDSAIDFTPARFSDGVRFALRGTALHRAPLVDNTLGTGADGPEGEKAQSAWPQIGGLRADYTDAEKTRAPGFPRHHPQGLSGGALWPIESLNLFNILLKNPQSRGGTIEQIALSPIGGNATQKAEFLDGKVTIISETHNGRVQRQQVEVLGRVCALWHRAKHVVVYERTVNPSAQFAPEPGDDPAGTRSRRPILRKVREYIELLQPERNYPDVSTASPRSAGFLERVRFNSRIINVDSAWSSEVGDFGWQIPLWNRAAARLRPQVYPMPDVAFVTTAEGAGDRPVVAQECRDPDFLVFFADFKISTSDTDLWESRLGLDFPNMPVARAITESADSKSRKRPTGDKETGAEGRRPPVGRFLPGLRRFTWRLAPAAQKTAINAGRAGKPVYVGLDSVTFMRATHADAAHQQPSPPLAAVQTLPLTSVKAGGLSDLGYWASSGGGGAPGTLPLSDAIGANGSFIAVINGNDPAAIAAAKHDLDALWATAVESVTTSTAGAQFKAFEHVASGVSSGALCQRLKDDAAGTIRRKEMLVRTAIADWVALWDDRLARGEADISKPKSLVISEWADAVIDHVRPLFTEASQDIAKIDESVERAHAIILDVGVEIDDLFKRARQRVEQFAAGYDRDKPWSSDRRKAFRAGIDACVSGVAADLEATIDEAAQRLATELNSVSQQIAGHVAKALRQIVVAKADVDVAVASVESMTDRMLRALDDALTHLVDQADPAEGKLQDLIDKVEANTELAKPEHAALKATALDLLGKAKTVVAETRAKVAAARAFAKTVDSEIEDGVEDVRHVIDALAIAIKAVGDDIVQMAADLAAIGGEVTAAGAQAIKDDIDDARTAVDASLAALIKAADTHLVAIGSSVDAAVKPALRWLDGEFEAAHDVLAAITDHIAPIAEDISARLKEAQESLAPGALLDNVVDTIVADALTVLLEPFPETLTDAPDALGAIRRRLQSLADEIGQRMHDFSGAALGALDEVSQACKLVSEGVAEAEAFLKDLGQGVETYAKEKFGSAYDALNTAYGEYAAGIKDAQALIKAVGDLESTARKLHNDLSRGFETANAYGDRVFDAVAQIDDGGLMAAPSNVLKLYSAVTSAPELAALKSDIDRIRSTFDELGDIIETTEANALFNRLGDGLKALGLSIPFDKISDRLLPADLSSLDIGQVFRNFGGAKLDHLFKGYKIPPGVRDAVKITHDFDEKQARAWVQVDIDAPFPGRRSLFSIGIFKIDFVDMRLGGRVRLEASKDQEQVSVTGFGRIDTTLDAVVGGQSMVRFEKFALSFSKERGLDIEFDPKNAKLNPQFKWIQDFLSNLYPELGGGLEWILEHGLPVGVQHDFVLPPMSLNFGTSGVSNLSLENHFKLRAFPDFILANRFNLSTMEQPFIFSVFIIGGTGYVQIEAEYNPVRDELMVLVEAAAGGSAQLAFAFGPFVGQVFITLSGVLSYRKLIGRSGGGLSISMVLVIAGHVRVAGIVTVGITLTLRLSYRDNGQVDASGTLQVTIRISRFFKLTARADVTYKLRGGKSETSVSTSGSAEIEDKDLKDKAEKAQLAARKLEAAIH